jgi:hypothetical protein
MNAITLLFTGTLLAGLWMFGLAIKAAVLVVVKPQGTTRRKLSSLAFAVALLVPGVVAAGVSLGTLTPASWDGAVHGLLLSALCAASCAIQLKLALAKSAEPVVNEAENDAAMAASVERVEPAMPAQADVSAPLESIVAPAAVAPATVVASAVAPVIAATSATSEETDELDAWADEQATPAAVTPAVTPVLTLVKATPAALPEVLAPASAALVVVDADVRPALDLVDTALHAESQERTASLMDNIDEQSGHFEMPAAMNDARYTAAV